MWCTPRISSLRERAEALETCEGLLLVKILQHPTTPIACDCGAVRRSMATHPRYYGTFPRVLGHYVRETGALTWPDAIRKMTLLPAATIGLVDRGMIAAGMAADITISIPRRSAIMRRLNNRR